MFERKTSPGGGYDRKRRSGFHFPMYRVIRLTGITICLLAVLLRNQYQPSIMVAMAVAGAGFVVWGNWIGWQRRKKIKQAQRQAQTQGKPRTQAQAQQQSKTKSKAQKQGRKQQ